MRFTVVIGRENVSFLFLLIVQRQNDNCILKAQLCRARSPYSWFYFLSLCSANVVQNRILLHLVLIDAIMDPTIMVPDYKHSSNYPVAIQFLFCFSKSPSARLSVFCYTYSEVFMKLVPNKLQELQSDEAIELALPAHSLSVGSYSYSPGRPPVYLI